MEFIRSLKNENEFKLFELYLRREKEKDLIRSKRSKKTYDFFFKERSLRKKSISFCFCMARP
jgi:hypothetical protein